MQRSKRSETGIYEINVRSMNIDDRQPATNRPMTDLRAHSHT